MDPSKHELQPHGFPGPCVGPSPARSPSPACLPPGWTAAPWASFRAPPAIHLPSPREVAFDKHECRLAGLLEQVMDVTSLRCLRPLRGGHTTEASTQRRSSSPKGKENLPQRASGTGRPAGRIQSLEISSAHTLRAKPSEPPTLQPEHRAALSSWTRDGAAAASRRPSARRPRPREPSPLPAAAAPSQVVLWETGDSIPGLTPFP